jgi:hypothetical protein
MSPVVKCLNEFQFFTCRDGKGESIPYGVDGVTPRMLDICQREIRIVHEDIADRTKEFDDARTALSVAELIYFLGFGYAKEDIERLHMEKVDPKVMEGTAKGVTPKEQSRIRKLISRLTF